MTNEQIKLVQVSFRQVAPIAETAAQTTLSPQEVMAASRWWTRRFWRRRGAFSSASWR